jgi:LPXTG-motif cell wall-anchored protein
MTWRTVLSVMMASTLLVLGSVAASAAATPLTPTSAGGGSDLTGPAIASTGTAIWPYLALLLGLLLIVLGALLWRRRARRQAS